MFINNKQHYRLKRNAAKHYQSYRIWKYPNLDNDILRQ